MIHANPHMLPKIRSPRLMKAMKGMPCTLRIAGFVPGCSCASDDTVVGCHLPVIGKGVSTKVTDLAVAAGCYACHRIIDGQDKKAWDYLAKNYPAAVAERMLNALVETHARLILKGYEWGKDWEVIQ